MESNHVELIFSKLSQLKHVFMGLQVASVMQKGPASKSKMTRYVCLPLFFLVHILFLCLFMSVVHIYYRSIVFPLGRSLFLLLFLT